MTQDRSGSACSGGGDAQVTVEQVARDPSWLPHHYDATLDAIQFTHVTRDEQRAATFLTDEYLPKERVLLPFGRAQVAAAATAETAPMHFILHSAFCCSTLVAGIFDRDGMATTLKEPQILNDIMGVLRRGADPRQVGQILDNALSLLARPFQPGEALIVKPSNILNGMARGLLTLRPRSNALLLYAPLETFVTSVAKKGIDGRLWVRELFIGQRTDGMVQNLGFTDEQFFGQTDLQIAAITWLAQQALFAQLIQQAPDRTRTLDSATLLQRPIEAVDALAGFFGVALQPGDKDAIAAGPAFRKHAKSGESFSTSDREREYRDATAAHGDEIRKVVRWAEIVSETAGIPLSLGNALI